jgi:hypothetical protein
MNLENIINPKNSVNAMKQTKYSKLPAQWCKSCNNMKLTDEFISKGKQFKMCVECRTKRLIYSKRYYHRHKGLTRVYTNFDEPIETVPYLDYSKCEDENIKALVDNLFLKSNVTSIEQAKFLMFEMIKYQQSE